MSELANAFIQLDEQTVYKLVDQKISEGVSPLDIIKECNQGLTEVGELFASGQYYLTELMFSAEIMQAVMEKLEPLISNTENKQNTLGTVVKVIIGGTICTENVRKFTGADAYANDAMTGVKFAKSVYGVE
jgi:methanogenic corrinoid protein MtbC1